MAGVIGSIYGIPFTARRVVKFNPLDKSITEIGPDFGDGLKWWRGAMAENGVIYCPPFGVRRGILKINTNTNMVTELDGNLLPQQGGGMWMSCAAALDGCIYCMPLNANRIMKLDPNNGDAMSSVGDDLGDKGVKYSGTVAGIDGFVYGIPWDSKRILKYDLINDITSFVEEETDEDFRSYRNGVFGRDGCFYAIARDGRVLKIDTTNNVHCVVGNSIESKNDSIGWGDGILGIDGCIYWPPMGATHIMKYDPHSKQSSLVGNNLGDDMDEWIGGWAAPDGIIYCLPHLVNRILAIDPSKEYILSLENNMDQFPEQLGCIFQPSDDIPEKQNLIEQLLSLD